MKLGPNDMTIDSIVLAALAAELNKILTGGRIDKIQQPSQMDVVLTIRAGGANHILLISADAQSARIHTTSSRRKNPQTAPGFCMLLRKYLEGAHLAEIVQPELDRILLIHFLAHDGERLSLIFEAMGKHSNLILVDGAGRILGAIKPVGRQKNRYREILPGKEYIPPPAQDKRDPMKSRVEATHRLLGEAFPEPIRDRSEVASWLVKTFRGISPFAAKEIALRSDGTPTSIVEEFVDFFRRVREKDFLPVYITDDEGRMISFYAFPSVQFPAQNQHERASINSVADMYFTSAVPKQAFEQAQAEVVGRLRHELKALTEAAAEVQHGIEASRNAEGLKETGELILSQMQNISPESESAELVDYYSPGSPTLLIDLDPRLSVAENASAYFKKYHKAVSGGEALRNRLAELQDTIAKMRASLAEAESASTQENVDEVAERLTASGVLLRKQEVAAEEKRKSEFEGHRITKTMVNGWEILTGHNSESNDYLVARVAKPNDLWLHVKASASAHVVIRTNNKPNSVPREVLMSAATIAAQHSDAKHSSLVPVDYTLRKYVRKPKGATSGKVIYQNEKTLYITP